MKGMFEHLAEVLDLDQGLRKGLTLTRWLGKRGRWLPVPTLQPI